MPDKTVPIDGNLTLDQTRDACVVEQNKGFRLGAITNSTKSEGGHVFNVNKADFFSDDFLATLLFVEPGTADPNAFKQQKVNEGWTHICSGSIWVQNQIKNVMVFGK